MQAIQQSRWLDVLWCILMSMYILAGTAPVPLHGDEPTQIFMGRDFYYHIQGNTEQVFLADPATLDGDAATEQQLRLINGTLPKYLFGIVAYLSGYEIDDINDQWLWGAGWDWNHENGHVPTEDLLLRTRYVSAILLALSAITFYGVGVLVANRTVGLFASTYYVLNPAILMNGRRVMMESSMLAFTILAVAMVLLALRHRHRLWYVAAGVVSGLAVASKHTSVVMIAAIFVVAGLYLLLTKKAQRQDLLRLIGAGLLSLVIFFGLNPAWWQNPIDAAQTVLELRQQLLADQIDFYGGYETISQQLTGFTRQALVVPPMYAETDVDGFLSEQVDVIARYQASPFHGISIGGSWIGAALLVILVFAGCIQLWRDETFDRAARWLLTGWLVAMLILTAGLTPLEWQRYYLPVYPIIGLLAAIGLQASLVKIKVWTITQ